MSIMLMGFYADSIMMLALGGASSLIVHLPVGLMGIALAVPFLSLLLSMRTNRALALAVMASLVAYAFASSSALAFLCATLAALEAMMLTKRAPGKGFLLLETLLYLTGMIVFPLARAHARLAFQLQLLLLAMVLGTGLVLSRPQKAHHHPAPLSLALFFLWILW